MASSNQLTVENVLGIFRRKFLLMIGSAVGLGILAFGASYLLPPRYASQTLILIRRQTVPEDLVKPVVTEDVASELATMKQQILSRSNLQPLVTSLNLFPSDPSIESRVNSLRKNIAIVPLGGDYRHAMNAFTVTCRASSASTAQALCSQITSLFISRNLDDQQRSVEETSDFIKQQLTDARNDLTAEDHKLAALEQKNAGMLPDEEGANAATLQSLLVEHNAAILAITQIEQQLADVAPVAANAPLHGSALPAATSATSPGPYDSQIADLKKTQSDLLRVYTPEYPGVIAVAQQIRDLESANAKALAARTAAHGAMVPVSDPRSARGQTQAARLQSELQARKAEVEQLNRRIKLCQSKIDAGPAVGEQYRQITRDHQVAADFYDHLQHEMNDSSLAVNLQNQQDGEQFQLIDPANLPDSPEFPKHKKIALMGLGGGAFLGVALAFFLEMRNPVITTETGLAELLSLPVLGNISMVKETTHRKFLPPFLKGKR